MDYRKFYKDYYKIDFGKEYEVHHIDRNRGNNDINNLILLPKKLHKQYHFYLTYLNIEIINLFDFKIHFDLEDIIGNGNRTKSILKFTNILNNILNWDRLKIDNYKIQSPFCEKDYMPEGIKEQNNEQ